MSAPFLFSSTTTLLLNATAAGDFSSSNSLAGRHAFFAEQFIPTIIFLAAGGYYTIELAGSRIRLVALNMNLYMEDIMDEMKFRRTHLRRRGGVRGAGVLKGEDPSLEAVTDADPMGQWAWLSNVMETATKKRQNVST